MLFGLNAWQSLLWIAGLEIISIPLIASLFTTIINGYYKAKQKHISVIAKAVGEGLAKVIEVMPKKEKIDGEKSD